MTVYYSSNRTANGNWILETNKSKTIKAKTNKVPEPKELKGDWDVSFPLLTGEVLDVKMGSGSWTENVNDEIKHFSGTATYKKTVEIDKKQIRRRKIISAFQREREREREREGGSEKTSYGLEMKMERKK